jgi:hypothetical protein
MECFVDWRMTCHFEPTTVNGLNIGLTDDLPVTVGNVNQDNLQDITLSVGFSDENLRIVCPCNLGDETLTVVKVFFNIDGNSLLLFDIVEAKVDDWVWSASLGILDKFCLGVQL